MYGITEDDQCRSAFLQAVKEGILTEDCEQIVNSGMQVADKYGCDIIR